MSNIRLLASLFAVFGSAAAAACYDDTTDASLRVINSSDFAIVEIHVTPVGSPSWGPNLLDGDTLEPGESLLLGVECGFYDALLVDEDGVDCEIHDLDLCLNDARWTIYNDTCTVFGAAKAAREAAAAAGKPSTPATAPATGADAR